MDGPQAAEVWKILERELLKRQATTGDMLNFAVSMLQAICDKEGINFAEFLADLLEQAKRGVGEQKGN